MPAVATMDRPGSAVIRVAGSTPGLGAGARRRLGPLGLGRRRLTVDVGDAEAAADARARAARAGRRTRRAPRPPARTRTPRRPGCRCGRGRPTSSTPGMSSSAATASAAAPEETEKPNFESSCPVRTNSWVCASTPGRDPDEDLGPVRSRRDGLEQAAEAVDLVEGVDDDAADAPLAGPSASSSVDLLLPCRTSRSGGHAGRERDVELATGGDVEVHALLVGQPGHGPAQEGLGGVGDAVAPGRDRLAAGVAQVVLVVDEERRAELLGQLEQVDAADVEVALLVDRRPCAGGDAAPAVRWRRRGPSAWRCRIRQHSAAPVRAGTGDRRRDEYDRPLLLQRPAPVAQRIEHRPPEPVAQVRVLPGALSIFPVQRPFLAGALHR